MTLLCLLVIVFLPCLGHAKALPAAGGDPGWPRVFERNGKRLTVYQPQVDSWQEYARLQFRCAVAVRESAKSREKFGVAEVEAETLINYATRDVEARPVRRELRFADVSSKEARRLTAVVNELLPQNQLTIVSLDRVLAYLESDQPNKQKELAVNLEPPKIFYSSNPAILLMFMGKPEFQPVEQGRTDLLFAVNSNWDVLFDSTGQQYFLLVGSHWLSAPDPLKGPWISTKVLPKVMTTLPNTSPWAEVRKNLAVKGTAGQVPVVLAATEPAELILTEGEPRFNPIPGTDLLQVTNTGSPLFFHSSEAQYYFLAAGRWFRAASPDGPWTAASTDLPKDFANIPDESEAAYVKASVPGTREALDAILLASVPTSKAMPAGPVDAEVLYDGEPRFSPIPGTTVHYANNTAEPVFLVDNHSYWCTNGTWLVSSTPKGPWAACAVVPPAIYSIPPTHPAHNVTYVTVHSATPATVVYNQTSGYYGEYVSSTGVVMFGMGLLTAALWYDHYHDHYYPAHYYAYGRAAVYNYGYGGYVAHSAGYGPGGGYAAGRAAYGPYGGAGRFATYNPATGTYTRTAHAHGPGGRRFFQQAYNPNAGGFAQQSTVSTGRGSAGLFHGEPGGRFVQGGSLSGPRGSAARMKSDSGAGAAARDTRRSQGAVAKGQAGNVYAGRNGDVYKRDSEGNWSRLGAGRSAKPEAQAPDFDRGGFERQASARQWGNSRTARSQQIQRGEVRTIDRRSEGKQGGRRR